MADAPQPPLADLSVAAEEDAAALALAPEQVALAHARHPGEQQRGAEQQEEQAAAAAQREGVPGLHPDARKHRHHLAAPRALRGCCNDNAVPPWSRKLKRRENLSSLAYSSSIETVQ